jgi:hypothetical protein
MSDFQARLIEEWATANRAERERLLAIHADEIEKLSPREREALLEKLGEI